MVCTDQDPLRVGCRSPGARPAWKPSCEIPSVTPILRRLALAWPWTRSRRWFRQRWGCTPRGRSSRYPDGDYPSLIAEDFRHRSFGHPWEHTLKPSNNPHFQRPPSAEPRPPPSAYAW